MHCVHLAMRAYMYALCASGDVNTQGFVWKVLCAIYMFFYSFIHESKSDLDL